MTSEEIGHAMQDDDHLSAGSTSIIHGWLSRRGEDRKELQPYWPFIDNIAVIDRISGKGRRIILPTSL